MEGQREDVVLPVRIQRHIGGVEPTSQARLNHLVDNASNYYFVTAYVIGGNEEWPENYAFSIKSIEFEYEIY